MTKEEMVKFCKSLDDWINGSVAAYEALETYRKLTPEEQELFYTVLKAEGDLS
jgi:flagellar biosynthesis regulator FlbT